MPPPKDFHVDRACAVNVEVVEFRESRAIGQFGSSCGCGHAQKRGDKKYYGSCWFPSHNLRLLVPWLLGAAESARNTQAKPPLRSVLLVVFFDPPETGARRPLAIGVLGAAIL